MPQSQADQHKSSEAEEEEHQRKWRISLSEGRKNTSSFPEEKQKEEESGY